MTAPRARPVPPGGPGPAAQQARDRQAAASDLAARLRRQPAEHRIGDPVRVLQPRGRHAGSSVLVGEMASAEWLPGGGWAYWVRLVGCGAELYEADQIEAIGHG